MTDEELQKAYAELMSNASRPAREHCPPVEALSAVVNREGDEARRLEVLDHVMSCPACKADFEILRATDAGVPRPARRTVPLVLAASVILALAGGLVWTNWRRGEEITRSDTPVMLASPVGEIDPSTPLRLAWRPVPHAASYHPEILQNDATVAWSATTTDTAITVPDALRLETGVSYSWWVRVELDTGVELTSEVRRFQFTRP
jgi:hypothetical protein